MTISAVWWRNKSGGPAHSTERFTAARNRRRSNPPTSLIVNQYGVKRIRERRSGQKTRVSVDRQVKSPSRLVVKLLTSFGTPGSENAAKWAASGNGGKRPRSDARTVLPNRSRSHDHPDGQGR